MLARVAALLLLASCDRPSVATNAPLVFETASKPKPRAPESFEPETRIEIGRTSAPDAGQTETAEPHGDAGASAPQVGPCPGQYFVRTCIVGGVQIRTADGRVLPNVGCRSTCSPRPPTPGPAIFCRKVGARAYRCQGAAP